MKKIILFSIMFIAATTFALTGPEAVSAQGDGTITTTVIDAGAFITVKESVTGEVLSLYRVMGDRIILVDSVVNSNKQSNMSLNLPKRYLHRMDVENK